MPFWDTFQWQGQMPTFPKIFGAEHEKENVGNAVFIFPSGSFLLCFSPIMNIFLSAEEGICGAHILHIFHIFGEWLFFGQNIMYLAHILQEFFCFMFPAYFGRMLWGHLWSPPQSPWNLFGKKQTKIPEITDKISLPHMFSFIFLRKDYGNPDVCYFHLQVSIFLF